MDPKRKCQCYSCGAMVEAPELPAPTFPPTHPMRMQLIAAALGAFAASAAERGEDDNQGVVNRSANRAIAWADTVMSALGDAYRA